jgi:hypothetical protein
MSHAALIALGHAFIDDQADHDELVDRWSRTLEARAAYRDERVIGMAGLSLCRQRKHRTTGLRGCHDCRDEVVAAFNGTWRP